MKKNIFFFDVEATSLFGSGFAVGALVFDRRGTEIDRFELLSVEGANKANEWVKENVIPNVLYMPKCNTDLELRHKFFQFYINYKDSCEFWSDVNFPVETNFLTAIVNDDFKCRELLMPYPLYDLSTIVGLENERSEYAKNNFAGLRPHHPLDDCKVGVDILTRHRFLDFALPNLTK